MQDVNSKQALRKSEITTDLNKGIDGMMFSKEAGDILIRFSIEQFRVFAVKVEIFLRAERVALEYVHCTVDEVFDKRLIS